jgi:hypothetical protein
MPLDSIGFAPTPRVLTPDESLQLSALRRARRRIRYRWMWLQYGRHGVLRTIVGRCASEAFGHPLDPVSLSCVRLLIRHIPAGHRRNTVGCVQSYNDDPLTTHADVLALFDRAIAEIEG